MAELRLFVYVVHDRSMIVTTIDNNTVEQRYRYRLLHCVSINETSPMRNCIRGEGGGGGVYHLRKYLEFQMIDKN